MFMCFRILGWIIAAACYAVVAVFAMAFLIFLLLPPGWLFIPLVGLERYLAGRKHRRRQADFALSYVEQALRLNQPLTQVIDAASRSESLGMRYRLRVLHACLLCGEGLAKSMQQAFASLGPVAISKIHAGERVGRLRQVLGRLQEQKRREADRDDQLNAAACLYPVFVLAGVSMVVFFYMILIAPKMQKIFDDFQTPLPKVTLHFFALGQWLAGPLFDTGLSHSGQGIPGFVYVVLLMLAVTVLGFILWMTPARRWLADVLRWRLPWIGVASRSRSMADVCEVFAESAEAGLPFDQALSEAAQLKCNVCLRSRLQGWLIAARAGQPFTDAARRNGLPALFVSMLNAAVESSRPAEVMWFLQRYYAARFGRIELLLRNSVVPAMVLALAVVVGWVVYSMYYPMVMLIHSQIPIFGIG